MPPRMPALRGHPGPRRQSRAGPMPTARPRPSRGKGSAACRVPPAMHAEFQTAPPAVLCGMAQAPQPLPLPSQPGRSPLLVGLDAAQAARRRSSLLRHLTMYHTTSSGWRKRQVLGGEGGIWGGAGQGGRCECLVGALSFSRPTQFRFGPSLVARWGPPGLGPPAPAATTKSDATIWKRSIPILQSDPGA